MGRAAGAPVTAAVAMAVPARAVQEERTAIGGVGERDAAEIRPSDAVRLVRGGARDDPGAGRIRRIGRNGLVGSSGVPYRCNYAIRGGEPRIEPVFNRVLSSILFMFDQS